MKSQTLSALFIFMCTAVFAQTLPVQLSVRQPGTLNFNPVPGHSSSVTDTVDVYIMRATSGSFYQSQDGGYIFGTSYYYDGGSASYFPITDETGIGFDAIGSAVVTDILFWAGAKYITGNADNITGKVYEAGTDSMPTTLLGSGTMSMQDVDTSLAGPIFTTLPITGGAPISSAFFVSIAYAGNDDTLGFLSSGPGDGLMEKRIRLKASADFGGAWIRMGELYPLLDVDLFFAPIVTLSGVGINDHFVLGNASIDAVYPSVATDQFHLDYTLAGNSSVRYFLFDLSGKKYFEQKEEQQQAGTYSRSFDASSLSAGNYFLSVAINGRAVTQKVVVSR
jgi:hypothetical protein